MALSKFRSNYDQWCKTLVRIPASVALVNSSFSRPAGHGSGSGGFRAEPGSKYPWNRTRNRGFPARICFFLLNGLLCGAIFYHPAPVPAEPIDPGSPLTLQSAIALAVQDNPDLAQMRARSEAMAAIPSQAGTLPDPVLSFNAMNLPTDSFSVSQEPMTQLQLGISQRVPFPGKLALSQEAAEYEAEAASNNVDETRLRLIRDVKTTWWLLFYLDQALQIVANTQDLLRQFVEIAQVKYTVGQGLQQDVLLAQTEQSRLLDQELQLTGMRRSEAARLNALLGGSSDGVVRLPREVIQELPDTLPEAQLYQIAESARPLLAERANQINAAESRVELAKKDYYPDLNIGAGYGFRSGDNPPPRSGQRTDLLSLQLSVNVPLFTYRKQAKAVDQRSSELLQRKYSFQDERNQVKAQISAGLADYERARQQFVLFKSGIIPLARQTVSSMLAGYQVNKVDFLNLIGSQITLFNYEIRYWRALSEANQALAKITAAVGKEVIHE
jgi:outer membrane protein, heavy metal efflux system